MLTQEYVRQLFDYDSETGVLTWRVGRHGVSAGTPVVASKSSRYLRVMVDYRGYKVSRVIWLWMTGVWPSGTVDHKDLNRLNNRWLNLRDVTQQVNSQNRPLQSNNKSGARGVCWSEDRQKWQASIKVDRRTKTLGYFIEFSAAVAARKVAESKYFQLPEEV